jgi:hypothetical protein
VFRVVTKYNNGSPRPIVERGPWHASKKIADNWCDALRRHGYIAHVETQSGLLNNPADDEEGGSNDDLMAALASMA